MGATSISILAFASRDRRLLSEDAHPDKYKHHGAIPGTVKIVKEWPPKREGGLHLVNVVWQTEPTAADVRKARAKWRHRSTVARPSLNCRLRG